MVAHEHLIKLVYNPSSSGCIPC